MQDSGNEEHFPSNHSFSLLSERDIYWDTDVEIYEQTIPIFISRLLVDLVPSNKALKTHLGSFFKKSYL